jgi:hypothetical protein
MKSSTLKINHWLSLIKFSHTIFALPFAIIGFLLGIKEIHKFPSWFLLIKIIACMVFARSAAMAFNRYIDKFLNFRYSVLYNIIYQQLTKVLIVAIIQVFILNATRFNTIFFAYVSNEFYHS